MDYAEEYEIQLLADMVQWSTHQSMEQTRMLMYSMAAPYMKQKKKLHEFMPLITDSEVEEQKPLEGDELKTAREMIKAAFNTQK